jgi:hypothetical protein
MNVELDSRAPVAHVVIGNLVFDVAYTDTTPDERDGFRPATTIEIDSVHLNGENVWEFVEDAGMVEDLHEGVLAKLEEAEAADYRRCSRSDAAFLAGAHA